jgi:hypothetical protein
MSPACFAKSKSIPPYKRKSPIVASGSNYDITPLIINSK